MNTAWKRLSQTLDAVHVFAHVAHEPYSLFLDSGSRGRYMLLAWNPVQAEELRHDDETPPFERLNQLLESLPLSEVPADAPPFLTGLMGYLGYELGWGYEVIGEPKANPRGIPDGVLMIPGCAVIIDREQGESWVVVTTEQNDAEHRLETLLADVTAWHEQPVTFRTCPNVQGTLLPEIDHADYLGRVEQVREYIAAGDIFQANLSYRIRGQVEGEGDPWQLYLALRESNNGEYACYFNVPGYLILSSSPELFLKWDGNTIETIPIKGTRPRGTTQEEDEAYRHDLATSEKDRAELLMIVDLERNDLGKFCKWGSVHVPSLFTLESYPTVWHQVAVVKGTIPPHVKAGEILQATFPGGSITGAPKIRSMQIIHELEDSRRGIYTGSIGFIDRRGTAEWNIAIRTMTWSDGELTLAVGGGIVTDSSPEEEFRETQTKAKGMLRAVERWSEGNVKGPWG